MVELRWYCLHKRDELIGINELTQHIGWCVFNRLIIVLHNAAVTVVEPLIEGFV